MLWGELAFYSSQHTDSRSTACVSSFSHHLVLIWTPEETRFGEDWEKQKLKSETNKQNLKVISIIHTKKEK
jgi:hypothetical protein